MPWHTCCRAYRCVSILISKSIENELKNFFFTKQFSGYAPNVYNTQSAHNVRIHKHLNIDIWWEGTEKLKFFSQYLFPDHKAAARWKLRSIEEERTMGTDHSEPFVLSSPRRVACLQRNQFCSSFWGLITFDNRVSLDNVARHLSQKGPLSDEKYCSNGINRVPLFSQRLETNVQGLALRRFSSRLGWLNTITRQSLASGTGPAMFSDWLVRESAQSRQARAQLWQRDHSPPVIASQGAGFFASKWRHGDRPPPRWGLFDSRLKGSKHRTTETSLTSW